MWVDDGAIHLAVCVCDGVELLPFTGCDMGMSATGCEMNDEDGLLQLAGCIPKRRKHGHSLTLMSHPPLTHPPLAHNFKLISASLVFHMALIAVFNAIHPYSTIHDVNGVLKRTLRNVSIIPAQFLETMEAIMGTLTQYYAASFRCDTVFPLYALYTSWDSCCIPFLALSLSVVNSFLSSFSLSIVSLFYSLCSLWSSSSVLYPLSKSSALDDFNLNYLLSI